ncbi:YfiR family protein [Phycisphaerales bacterium AB-hyl4]|uniref:YfiR family protein n=1 Tax=Natronomicrosphaera hydrolytica TaxID=3242702 RepID=A0ABV4U051_9BACT
MARFTQNTIAMAMILVMVFIARPSSVMGQSIDENKAAQVKAGYLVNFLRFARWPEQAFADDESPLVIVIVEPDPLARVLDQMVRRLKVADRSVVVHRVSWPERRDYNSHDQFARARHEARAAMRQAHLLLLPSEQLDRAAELLSAIGDAPVLTVGDGPVFMSAGVMLGFELERHRIVFHANAERIRESPVRVSSRLLSLARVHEP